MNKSDQISGWIWVASSIFIYISSINAGLGTFSAPGPGLFPFICAISLAILSLVFLIKPGFRKAEKEKLKVKYEGFPVKRPIFVFMILLLYSFSLEKIGYIVDTFIFLSILLSIMPGRKRKWWFPIVGTFLIVIISYILFAVLLQIRLPWGILRIWKF